jgi:D-alanyl-D-alanine carboxypeptidase/D-alanyl-D-alanine-endopeptidase (penicillin-binding protein 4)
MDRRRLLAFMIVVGLSAACGVTPAFADQTRTIQQIIQGAGLRDTKVSVFAMDLSTGDVMASINADEPMIPASNMKLVTAAAALDLLGPEFVFRTQLFRVDSRDSHEPGTIDLLVKGDGDPAFGDPVLLKRDNLSVDDLLNWWTAGVKEAGITSVEHLIVDDRVFDDQFTHPTWPQDQLNNWWCAQVAGLNFYDNTLDIVPERTTEGQAPRVRIIPEAPFLITVNRAATSNADTFWISRKPNSNELTFWGKVRSNRVAAIPVTVHDPPILFSQIFSHRLGQTGIRVKAIRRLGLEDSAPVGRPIRTVQTTLPLVLARCNQDSQNLFAEALLKRMGYSFTGAPGSWENGAAAVRQAMRNRLGPRSVAIRIADGSGMSRDNQVTARALVELLRSMNDDPRRGVIFRDSLAEGGTSGTLQRRFGAGMNGTVYGKSGYLNGVSGLSGYIVIPNSDPDLHPRVIAFSCLFNGFKPPLYNHHMKTVQDQIVRALDQHYAPTRTAGAGE